MNKKAETAITAFLAAQEPATLEEICWELQTQLGLKTLDVLPVAITAIAALQEQGQICQYDPDPEEQLDGPLDYAWLLSEQTLEHSGRAEAEQAERDREEFELLYYSGLMPGTLV